MRAAIRLIQAMVTMALISLIEARGRRLPTRASTVMPRRLNKMKLLGNYTKGAVGARGQHAAEARVCRISIDR